jgi:GH15 family glucan-1,4-alpha-glucosidase
MSYLPIERYGIIGDMHTVALVGVNGSIDWWCYPHFDSPSVFGAILDDVKGGCFQITPDSEGVRLRQLYFPDSNVLITRFLSPDGVAELTDFMPVEAAACRAFPRLLCRRVTVVRGTMPFRLLCQPAFDYARAAHDTTVRPDGAVFRSPGLELGLSTAVPLRRQGSGVTAAFVLSQGDSATFVLSEIDAEHSELRHLSEAAAEQAFRETVAFWHRWLSRSTYRGRWREMVNRSALALKLMTFEPTGAIVAAPTCSLPANLSGTRNWDYRYTWIRDASFTLYGFMRIGLTDEAHHFIEWLKHRIHEQGADGSLQTVYSIEGKHELPEDTLDHLAGYQDLRPVRLGNGAYKQLQLDIYGELMDSVYLYNKYGRLIDYDLWTYLRRMLDWVVDNWQQPDEGIWEVRDGRQHFVYSKLMCWIALDRGLRLADKRSFPADRNYWLRARDTIYEDIMARGWNASRQAFIQSYGNDVLDASNLFMPLSFFIAPTDPRMLSTLDAIVHELASDSLVRRYSAAGAGAGTNGTDGTFSFCSFWLVEALTRAGRLDEARLMFEKMLGYANHLGLYAEEIGPSGEALGNFPQAFTHLALISAAFNLNRALGTSG